jgi:hypothetical protein
MDLSTLIGLILVAAILIGTAIALLIRNSLSYLISSLTPTILLYAYVVHFEKPGACQIAGFMIFVLPWVALFGVIGCLIGRRMISNKKPGYRLW